LYPDLLSQCIAEHQDGRSHLHTDFVGSWNAYFGICEHAIEESTERLLVSVIWLDVCEVLVALALFAFEHHGAK